MYRRHGQHFLIVHVDWKHYLDFPVSAGARAHMHTHPQLHLVPLKITLEGSTSMK